MKKNIQSHFILLFGVIAALTITSGFAQTTKTFSDLSTSHKNYTAITDLQSRGIISGYPDGSFQPERTVNRVEALKMVILTAENAKKLAASEQKKVSVTFPDIDKGAWYMTTLEKAVSYNIVSGYPDGNFRPEKTVNLAESLKMSLNSFEINTSSITVSENPYKDAFASEWYARFVQYAKEKNLIDADDKNMIYPNQGMKRGTLAEVLYRLLRSTKTTDTITDTNTLKALAEKHSIRFGAFYEYAIRSDLYNQIFEREMNVMAAGTFWTDGSRQSRSEFDFSEMDAKVNWGRARDMELHGLTLVWFEEITDWLKATPNADVEAIMNTHIDTMVGRYAGKIKLWDVVNEAMNDDNTGTLRQGHKWAEAMGDDYISKAFVRAHAADPNAILRYNDFYIESNKAKFEGVKALLISLKKQGVPVHALGWQMHVKPGSFDPGTLLARMNEIADLGFDNYISELDVELPENANAADYEQQKQTFKEVIKTFLSARRHKTVVVWGLRDGDPWSGLTKNHPLLFDEKLQKKPAYFGVQEALK